jgi:hypothetical protein
VRLAVTVRVPEVNVPTSAARPFATARTQHRDENTIRARIRRTDRGGRRDGGDTAGDGAMREGVGAENVDRRAGGLSWSPPTSTAMNVPRAAMQAMATIHLGHLRDRGNSSGSNSFKCAVPNSFVRSSSRRTTQSMSAVASAAVSSCSQVIRVRALASSGGVSAGLRSAPEPEGGAADGRRFTEAGVMGNRELNPRGAERVLDEARAVHSS